ncbi:MAG TPA: CHASE3 domain-containing protein, partial [Brevundimonas sp.]|nr:CHASE3 domain-containing protein [Brevundimonas sp.]
MNLDNVRISRKLAGAFALIVAVIVALGAVVFMQVGALEKAKDTVALAETVTAKTSQLKRSVDQQESRVRAYMLTGKPEHLQRIEAHKALFRDGVVEMKALTAHIDGAAARMDALDAAVKAYQDAVIDPEIRLAGNPATRAEALALTEGNIPTQMMEPIDTAFETIVQAQAARKAAAVKDQAEAFATTKIALGVGVLAALGLSILFGFGLARMIATPIAAMTSAMRRLAGGDKTIIVPAVGRKDEVGEMADALLAFKDAAIANERLEAEAAAQRAAAEEERVRVEAEKARTAEEDRIAVTALGQGLQAMANGDLTHRMTAQVAARSEQLKTDFNTAIAQLEQAVAVVVDNVAAIRSGSSEISQASDDLS